MKNASLLQEVQQSYGAQLLDELGQSGRNAKIQAVINSLSALDVDDMGAITDAELNRIKSGLCTIIACRNVSRRRLGKEPSSYSYSLLERNDSAQAVQA